jgi:phage RecT family recombinase
MPDDNHAIAATETRDIATLPISEAIEAYAPQFAAVLPPNIPLDHFTRMVMTAISVNPDLISADRRSFFNACVKCASDGLLPDGREAALVIMRTKVKNRTGGETYIDAIAYLPMVAGIRKRMRNSGEVESATAEVVYRRDHFKYELGDDAYIEHKPPPLDEDRGDAIGAYAIIKLTSGETLREVMRKDEIERARAISRAATSPAGPWVKWWSEMARKTVLRRCAKAAPQAAVLEKLLARDDELPEPPPASLIEPPPPRPRREQFVEHQPEPEPPPFAFTDPDGEIHEFDDPESAASEFNLALTTAAKARGEDGISGLWESNGALLSALRDHDRADLADGLSRDCGELLARARAAAAEAAQQNPERVSSLRPGEETPGGHIDADDGAGGSSEAKTRQSAPADARPVSPVRQETQANPGAPGERGGSPAEAATAPKASPLPQSTARPASARPAARAPSPAVEITGQSGVEVQDMGYLHPEMERQAQKAERLVPRQPPAGELGLGVPDSKPAPADDRPPNMEIPTIYVNGKPDWRAWTITAFLPALRSFTETGEEGLRKLSFFLGDNAENRKWAEAAGLSELISPAVLAQAKIVDGKPA